MAPRLPFNKRDRHRSTQSRLGYRPVNGWGDGDLPAPWAEGDIVDVPPTAVCVNGLGGDEESLPRWWVTGPCVIAYACSIDEGDAWYFRLCNGKPGPTKRQMLAHGPEWECSDRLHVAFARRVGSFPGGVDWMAGCTLIDTADPDGLARRERMLADGWSYPPPVEGWLPHG